MLGEKVYTINNFKQQISDEIDLSDSPKEIYFLIIYNGENIYTEKNVIQ